MKVLALIGSPRNDGNTVALVDQILKGIVTVENTKTEKLYLYDYTISLSPIVVPAKKGITSAA